MANKLETAYEYAKDVRDGKRAVGKYVKLAVERYYRDYEKPQFYFDETAAQKALTFFDFLSLSKGEADGAAFKLEPWQSFLVANIFGWKKKSNGKRRFTEAYVELSKKNGKALAIDTPIPTPDGWRTMGDLKVGDHVFDQDGKPCNVTFATEIMHGHKCYEVVFSDGCKVIADAEHLWETEPQRNGRPFGSGLKGLKQKDFCNQEKNIVYTTEQIKNTLYYKMAGTDVANHRIATCNPVEYSKTDLPIHPYVLGFWLGDGNSDGARVTIGDQDRVLVSELEKFTHIRESHCCRQENASGFTLTDGDRSHSSRAKSVNAKLRALGLLGNKHIPGIYLTADVESRKELLKGLMDTDGYASKAGQCEFTTTKEALYLGFMELARSLGYKPSVKIADSFFRGRLMGKKYRVQFWAFQDDTCFKLERKTERLKKGSKAGKRSSFRQILEVNEVESVPVRCIQVDSPRSLYLCGEGFIPTHNTTIAAGIGLLCMIFDNESGPEVYAAAYTRDQASICFDEAVAMVERSAALRSRVDRLKYNLSVKKTRAKFNAVSHDAKNTEGKNSHCVLFDEYHVHKTDDVKTSLQSGMAARKQPLFFIITTAGDNKQGPCYKYRDICINVLEDKVEIDNVFTVIYNTDEGDDWRDETTWYKSNPNLNVSVELDFLRGEFKKAQLNGRAEVEFKTKHLNMWVDSAVTWIPHETWKQQEGAKGWLPPKHAKCYGGLDLASTSDITSFALYFPEYNYLTVSHYVPEEAAKNAMRGGIDYMDWIRDGHLVKTPGKTTDYNYIKEEISRVSEYWDLLFCGYDRWNSSYLVQELDDMLGTRYVSGEKSGYENVMQKFGQGYVSMSTPTKEFEKLVMDGDLIHDGNPVTAWMLGNVKLVMDAAGNIKPDKGESKDKIDGIVASIMAIGEYLAWNWENRYQNGFIV